MKVTIEVNEVPKDTLYLTQHLGNGSLGKTEFDASFTLPQMGLLVSVDGKKYLAPSQTIISAIIDGHLAKSV